MATREPPPDEQRHYTNWDFNALGTVYRTQTGRSVFEAFAEDIARPLGMQDFVPAEHTR